ncbi:MAG: oligosaccharide flippase family protein [Candidatus Sumerlaeia bacterium]|nr:oligosaccharide flippase family protein [Candidatus Sumerlaeia bacterium]
MEPRPKQPSLAGWLPTLLSGAVVRALAALRLFVFAPLLGPEGFGLLRIAQSAMQILTSVGALGMPQAYPRFFPELEDAAARRAFWLHTMAWSCVGIVVLTALLAAMPSVAAELLFNDVKHRWLALGLAAMLPASWLLRSMIGAAQGLGKFRDAAVGETIQSVGFFGAGLALLYVFPGRVLPLLLAFAAAMALGGAYLLARSGLMRSPVGTPAAADITRRAVRYAAWYMLIPVTNTLFELIDRWMVSRALSMATAGAYSFIPLLGLGMFLFGASLGAVALRTATRMQLDQGRAAAERYVWSCVKIVFLASLAYSVAMRLAEPLVWRIFGPEWSRAALLLPYFLCYYALFNVAWLVATFAALREAAWIQLAAGVLGTAANAALNAALIPEWGVLGAAAGTVAGQALLLAAHVAYSARAGVVSTRSGAATLALPLLMLAPVWLQGVALAALSWAAWRGWYLDREARAMLGDYARRMLARR